MLRILALLRVVWYNKASIILFTVYCSRALSSILSLNMRPKRNVCNYGTKVIAVSNCVYLTNYDRLNSDSKSDREPSPETLMIVNLGVI